MRPRSGHAVRLVAASLVALCAGVPVPATAQDPLTPVPGSFCTLITDGEASTAFGIELVLTEIGDTYCSWSPPGGDGSWGLGAVISEGTLADQKEYYTQLNVGFQDISVGRQAALITVYGDPPTEGEIFTEALGDVLRFSWYAFEELVGMDVGAALIQVTEAALPRMSSITIAGPTPTPAPTPVPSFRTDPELAAMFPDTIAGRTVTPFVMLFMDLLARNPSDPERQESIDRLSGILASHGRTLDDISFGLASDYPTTISAYRIREGDGSAIADFLSWLIEFLQLEWQLTPGQIAGRDVTIATIPGGETYVLLSSGEVLWQVVASEPVLSEIIAALP